MARLAVLVTSSRTSSFRFFAPSLRENRPRNESSLAVFAWWLGDALGEGEVEEVLKIPATVERNPFPLPWKKYALNI